MLSLIFNRGKFIAAINFSQTTIFFRETKTTFFARLFDNVGITDIRDGLHISNDFSLLDHFRRVGRSIKCAVHILFTISACAKFCETFIAISVSLIVDDHLLMENWSMTRFTSIIFTAKKIIADRMI